MTCSNVVVKSVFIKKKIQFPTCQHKLLFRQMGKSIRNCEIRQMVKFSLN